MRPTRELYCEQCHDAIASFGEVPVAVNYFPAQAFAFCCEACMRKYIERMIK
jgi:hypothetical protein